VLLRNNLAGVKIRNPKHQIPNKSKVPSSKHELHVTPVSIIRALNFGFVSDLVLRIQCLVLNGRSAASAPKRARCSRITWQGSKSETEAPNPKQIQSTKLKTRNCSHARFDHSCFEFRICFGFGASDLVLRI
jgi:hypothetical protein